MDLLLEALKVIYEDQEDEQLLLEAIEDQLLQPTDEPQEDPVEEPAADAPPEPEVPEEPEVAPPAPAPVAKPVPKQAPKATATLPDITSAIPTPPPAKKPAAPAPSPAAPTEPIPEPDGPAIPAGDITPATKPDGSVGVYSDLQAKVLKKLVALKKQKKAYSAKVRNSKALSKIIYSPSSHTLTVTFLKNGRSYRYRNVGMGKASELIASNQKGELLNRTIKGVKPYKEV